MVAHTFTCPQGLYFNSLTDGCDFRRNVDCEGKDEKEEEEDDAPASTTSKPKSSKPSKSGNEPETLEDVLSAIKEAGTYVNTYILFNTTLGWDILREHSKSSFFGLSIN